MKICAVEMENYGPFYGKHRFEFQGRGLVAVLGDNRDEPRMNSNGAGKSHLTDALDWGLFGVHPRGDGPDTLINDEAMAAGGGARVVVFAEDEALSLRIERTRRYEGHSGVRLFADGEEVSSMDGRETQRFIQYHLGVDREVFHAAVLFAQGDLFNFADATDGERLSILTKVLRLEMIDHWQEAAKEQARLKQAEAAQLASQDAKIAGQIEALQSVDDGQRAADYEAQRQGQLARIDADAQAGIAQLPELQAAAAGLEDDQRRMATYRPLVPGEDLAQAKDGLERARKSHQEAIAYASGAEHEATAQARGLKLLLSGTCSQCRQPIAPQRRDEAAAASQAATAEAQRARDTVEKWREYVLHLERDYEGRHQAFQQAQVAHEAKRAELASHIRNREYQARQLTSLRERLEALKLQRRDIAAAQNPVVAERDRTRAKVAELQGTLHKHRQSGGSLLAEQGRISFWLEAFGNKGLKSYVLDARLAEMTEAANYWVRQLTGGTYWVRLETQTTLKSGATRNKFTVRVFSGRGGKVIERNYKSWSGGQKQRVSLAIDFGLSRLIAKRAQKNYDVLILDEIFKHLDAKGRDAVMEMLQKLREEKSTILVVDHDAEFQAMFEQRVTVRMQGGRATIHEGDDHDAAGDPHAVPGATHLPPQRPAGGGGGVGPEGPGADAPGGGPDAKKSGKRPGAKRPRANKRKGGDGPGAKAP